MAVSITSTTFNVPRLDRLLAMLAGDKMGKSLGRLTKDLLVPFVALIIFLSLWSVGAQNVETSLGVLPGPGAVAPADMTTAAWYDAADAGRGHWRSLAVYGARATTR